MGLPRMFVLLLVIIFVTSSMATITLGAETIYCRVRNPAGTIVGTNSATYPGSQCGSWTFGCTATCNTATNPACCNTQGQFTWEVSDNPPAYTCVDGSINPGNSVRTGNAYYVNFDTAEFCTDVCAGLGGARNIAWGIGGTTNLCCGDGDSGQYVISRKCATGCTSSPTDLECCANSNDCNMNDVCTRNGRCELSSNLYCGSGTWYDSDGNAAYCNACGSYFPGFPDIWSIQGDDCNPAIPGTQTTCCCGDDIGEYRITCADTEGGAFCNSVAASARVACCGQNSDCVFADTCYNAGVVHSGRQCEFTAGVGGTWNDSVGPSVNVSDGPGAWVNTPTAANILCTDTGSGCDMTSRRFMIYPDTPPIGGCPTQYSDYTGPGSPTTINVHSYLCAAALDNTGFFGFSTAPQHPKEYLIDTVNPNTTITNPSASSWQSANFLVQFTDTDLGGSGIDPTTCEYKIWDNGVYVPDASWRARSCLGQIIVQMSSGECDTEGSDTCRVEARVTDNAGNPGPTESRLFSIDSTPPPTCSLNTISQDSGQEYQHFSGTTIFYNTVVGGSFTVYINADDVGGSGINRVVYPATVSGAGSDGTGPSPYTWTYMWDGSDSYDAAATVTCVDNVGYLSTTQFTVDWDITPPVGGSLNYPDGPWNSTTVTVDFGTVSDGVGSGINASTPRLYRQSSAGLAGGACTLPWSGWGAFPLVSGPLVGPPNTFYNDNTVVNARCYQYRYVVDDNVLNSGTYTSVNEVMVDTSPPAGPATTDNNNVPDGTYDDDGQIRFDFAPGGDPETGLADCMIEIDDATDFATPLFVGWVGTGPSYTWAGGVNAVNYTARVRCRDNAGNTGTAGAMSDGIVVDTEDPVIGLVNDVVSAGDTSDLDSVPGIDFVGAYWEASDSASTIVYAEYALFEDLAGPAIRTVKNWNTSGIFSAASGNMVLLNFTAGTLPELLMNGRRYFFNVTVVDNTGRSASAVSDGFVVSACEAKPCGLFCNLTGISGVCDGAGMCYLGGGCGHSCAFPAGNRACYDNSNNPVPCANFTTDPLTYCGRFGATKCGDTALCWDSITTQNCLNPVVGAGVTAVISGAWTTYSPPPAGMYGPNKPLTINVTGIGIVGAPAQFRPLLECTFISPFGVYYLDRWGRNDAYLSFSGFVPPVGSGDGIWNLTGCALMSDYSANDGWVIDEDITAVSLQVDTTPPTIYLKNPVSGGVLGPKLNVTWNSNDPVVNGISAGIRDHQLQYIDPIVYAGGGAWFNVPGITANYSTVDISTEANGTTFCFRVRATDNADNSAPWSCDPGPPAAPDFTDCNCSVLIKDAPPNVVVTTFPQQTMANPSWFMINWSSGTKCYEVQFNVTNSTGDAIMGWTRWGDPPYGDINDMLEVGVWDGGASFFEINCTSNLEGAIFRPLDVLGEDPDGRGYSFRVRAVQDGVGYTRVSDWVYTSNVSVTDRTAPFVQINAVRDLDGSPVPQGGSIMTGETVTISVVGDPSGTDFSGVNESWLIYNITSASGPIGGGYLPCPGSSSSCNIVLGPWFLDYNVSYQGFSKDSAGNLGWSTLNMFLIRAPMALATSIRELYLTLGSYDYMRINVANRQNVNEHITLELQPDYYFSKFVDSPGAIISTDMRTMNVSLSPMETKHIDVLVYTADIGEWNLTVYGNSTLPGHENITGWVKAKIRVVFPVQFSGISWPALLMLFTFAALAYIRFGISKR